MRMETGRSGFTLIELMIVIVIIGLLAAISINVFWAAKDRGLEGTLKSDLKGAAVQQELYFERHGVYAPSPAVLTEHHPSPGVSMTITHSANTGWAATAAHGSLPTTTCGLIIGDAPAGVAHPATFAGVLACTN